MSQEQHRPTLRVLAVLEHLAASEEGETLTQLSQALQVPKSSLFPVIHTLQERRYLHQDDVTGRYRVGPSAHALGAALSTGRGMSPVVQIMEHLVSRCQETCQLAILDQGQVFYVEKVDSNQTIRTITRVGDRRPANATALGKALLSGLSDDQVRELYPAGLPRLTAQTITDFDVLLHQLEEIRQGGFALEQGESTAQLSCCAVPLRQGAHVFAAISIATPLFRVTEEKDRLIRRGLLEAREAIERLAERRDFILL